MPAGHRAAKAGRSLIERMWGLLDEVMDSLMGRGWRKRTHIISAVGRMASHSA